MLEVVKQYKDAYAALSAKLAEYEKTRDYDLWLEIDEMNRTVVRPALAKARHALNNDIKALQKALK